MVSSTQQYERIRKRKQTTSGKQNKRARRRMGTPTFAVHPTGYDAKAADAKQPEAAPVRKVRKEKKPKAKAANKPAK